MIYLDNPSDTMYIMGARYWLKNQPINYTDDGFANWIESQGGFLHCKKTPEGANRTVVGFKTEEEALLFKIKYGGYH